MSFVIETERLLLRELTLDDVDAMFAILGDAEAMKYYPRLFSRDDAVDWINRSLERYRRDGFSLYAVALKTNTGNVIGDCGLIRQEVEGESLIEVAYHFRCDCWGRGYATEAARSCMSYAFRRLNAPKVVSLIRPENVPSRRVAERNGMAVERQVTVFNAPHLLYAMRRENYGQT